MLRRALEGTVGRCEPGTGKIICRNAAPSTERSHECRRNWAHCHEYGGITVLRNQRNYTSSDTASQPGTVQSSVKSAEVPTKPTFLILYRCMSGLLATAEPTHYSRHILNVWASHTHRPPATSFNRRTAHGSANALLDICVRRRC